MKRFTILATLAAVAASAVAGTTTETLSARLKTREADLAKAQQQAQQAIQTVTMLEGIVFELRELTANPPVEKSAGGDMSSTQTLTKQ